MSAATGPRVRRAALDIVPQRWVEIHRRAPQVALTMLAYLEQMRVSARPATVKALETDLRTFALFVVGHDPDLRCVAGIGRSHVEAFKFWQRAQPVSRRPRWPTQRFVDGSVRSACSSFGLSSGDGQTLHNACHSISVTFPKRDESLPKFLDDGDYIKFMRALDQEPNVRRRLSVELLARTGMRVGELCELEANSVTIMAGHPWLRIPVGKLHNDRFVPLHPHLVELITEYQSTYGPHAHGYLISGEQGVLNRYAVQRWVSTVARRAGIGHVHPHKLSHTLATQAINRGMSLDAIAALLGHRSLDMTMRYARISNKVVADEYDAVSAKVDALYKTIATETPTMRRLRIEHTRMLGNGYCKRPKRSRRSTPRGVGSRATWRHDCLSAYQRR